MEETKKKLTTQRMVIYAFMGALSFGLMMIHLPFKYLGFLELEFSDIPAIVCGFAYGPVAAVIIEFIKNVLKVLINTTTGGVGELANFIVSIGYVVPCAILFRGLKKNNETVRNIIAGLIGTLSMAAVGIVINYFITVPLYAKLFGGMEAVVGVCSKTIPAIKGVGTVVILGITPFNLVKGIIISIVGILVYKSIKGILAKF